MFICKAPCFDIVNNDIWTDLTQGKEIVNSLTLALRQIYTSRTQEQMCSPMTGAYHQGFVIGKSGCLRKMKNWKKSFQLCFKFSCKENHLLTIWIITITIITVMAPQKISHSSLTCFDLSVQLVKLLHLTVSCGPHKIFLSLSLITFKTTALNTNYWWS